MISERRKRGSCLTSFQLSQNLKEIKKFRTKPYIILIETEIQSIIYLTKGAQPYNGRESSIE